ncbi:MAG: (d)CMP kinase [Calditrichia bacterium]
MAGRKKITIAIDGPAASGKSTTARLVAQRLGYLYIDSGAMYRAITLKAIQAGIPTTDSDRIAELAANTDIQLGSDNRHTVIFMNGKDVSRDIRSPEVDQQISPVAANVRVREILVKKQQEMGKDGGVVMDGRDIGTVVFPHAELKIYMIASVEARAERRLKEQQKRGIQVSLDTIISDIRHRDNQDMNRSHGPLKKAPDAIEIDTTHLTIPQQVEKIVQLARERIKKFK